VSYAAWRAGVEAELGADGLSRRLRAMTEDGIAIEPLYAPGGQGDGEARNLAGRVTGLLPRGAGGFRIRQRFPIGTSAEVLYAALKGGVQSLEFEDNHSDPKFERTLRTFQDLELLGLGSNVRIAEASWEDLRLREGASIDFMVPTSYGEDPIGRWLRRDGTAAQARGDLAGQRPTQPHSDRGDRYLRATGETFHEAGATTGMTLGATMAVALTYLRAMVDGGHEHLRKLERAVETFPGPPERMDRTKELIERGVNPSWIASLIEVRLPCGPRFFESAAMIRAARLVWARILEVAGIPPTPLQLVASTGRRTLTRHDPWNNALRNTSVAFAAAIGGADVLQLLPHDVRNAESSAAALRLARTTGLILQEESHLGRVLDPAEGSWFLESLTEELAEKAWSELRRIEAAGGIIAAIESGELSRRIAEIAAARHERVAARRHPIIGVTEHPVEGEVVVPSAMELDAAAIPSAFPFRPDAAPFESTLR
jgi:methylmalonyl-CoA mutase